MTETTTATSAGLTPVETLRAAATKLRETAEDPIRAGDVDEWAKYYAQDLADLPDGDGPWIALMSPALAEPLAVLLEVIAVQVTSGVHAGNDYCDLPLAIGRQVGDGINSCDCRDVYSAIAVALLVLGEAP